MPLFDLQTDKLLEPLSLNLQGALEKVPGALVTLVLGLLVIRLLSYIVSWLMGFVNMPKGLKEILVSLMDALLMIFLIIVVLQKLGLGSLAFALSAFLAAIGIAVGSGSATLVSDILGGITLARDRNFSIGDIVEAGEEKVKGEIVSMDMRRTRIRDNKGQVHSLPNSVIERKAYTLITKKRDRTDQ
ncbi:MAG TPA: mechanosensitive ion channel family protein [Candidatus Saccharimonadia bacterium]